MQAHLPLPSAGVSLRALFPDARIQGASDVRATSCCSDSRVCRPGDLFVAIAGTDTDGHHHAAEAIRRGATAILAERPLPQCDVPVCLVDDTREALGTVCHALAGNPSHRLPVIGVTGTSGKTTTSCLVASILLAAGQQAAVGGTLGYCDGRRTRPVLSTTPGPALLADWLARSEAQGCTHAVLEVSSHALAQRRTAGTEFDAACVVNVRRDHLDFHGTLKNYQSAKARLLAQLRDGGAAALNLDDAVCRQFLQRVDGPVVTFAMHRDADVTATVIERCVSEQTFLLSVGSKTVPVRTAIVGDHHVENCLAAASIGIAYGVDLTVIARGLERIDEMPGRLQRIECGQPFSVFVDPAQTPDALKRVLSTLRQVCAGRLICVFGAAGRKNRTWRPMMGKVVERAADLAILTDDEPDGESPSAIIEDILRGLKRPADMAVVPDRAAAIRLALASARVGDCVLLAGKGNEQRPIVSRPRIARDDREVAKQWLYATAADSEPGPIMRRAA